MIYCTCISTHCCYEYLIGHVLGYALSNFIICMECLYGLMNVHVHIPLPPIIGTSGVGKGGFGPLPLNGNIIT